MRLENGQNQPEYDQIDPKMLKIRQIDPKISRKGIIYFKNSSYDKKRWSCPQNPTAGPQTLRAPRA